ncbi:unnamed protein product, partial [Effrenium voratum]
GTFDCRDGFSQPRPLTIGRAHQADDFEKLIPVRALAARNATSTDEALRSCLSRNHFTMSFDGRGSGPQPSDAS